jgi:hypothetical protein
MDASSGTVIVRDVVTVTVSSTGTQTAGEETAGAVTVTLRIAVSTMSLWYGVGVTTTVIVDVEVRSPAVVDATSFVVSVMVSSAGADTVCGYFGGRAVVEIGAGEVSEELFVKISAFRCSQKQNRTTYSIVRWWCYMSCSECARGEQEGGDDLHD